MKNTIISILIFIILIFSILLTKGLQHKKIDNYINKLENISILIEGNSWDNALVQINKIQNKFNYESEYMSIISSNEYVDEIVTELNDLDYYSKKKDIDKTNFYINSIVNDLQHLQELQFINVKNIF